MPLPSQFSLSVELTKFIPAASIVNVTYQAAIDIARRLQKSGSDIIVEEDLALIFGRNRILPRFESSFRTAVKESRYQQFSGYLDIVLADGAGPTVHRSLQDPRFFSMIVQLSLLAWCHDTDTLAASMAVACERRVRDAPPEQQHFPTRDGIAGSLRQCRDQTAHFQWILLFRAVEEELALDQLARRSSRKLPFVVLQGGLDFFFAVQSLPEDRLVHVVSHEGCCVIVVWAHHVLGLNVTVHIRDEMIKFGQGKEQVVLEYQTKSEDPTSMCLLSADGEEVFRIASDTEWCPPLHDDFRVPAEGYGKSVLEAYFGTDDAVCQDLAHVTVANCWNAAVEYSQEYSRHPRLPMAGRSSRRLSCFSTKRIFEVGCFLFGDASLNLDTARRMAREMSLERSSAEYDSLELLIQSSQATCLWQKKWYPNETPLEVCDGVAKSARLADLTQVIEELSCVLFAFTAVSNLSDCSQLPLCRGSGVESWSRRFEVSDLTQHPHHSIELCEPNVLFDIMARLLLGFEHDVHMLRKASLVSSWGWSIYLPTIGAVDPASIEPESIKVARGVPARYDERKSWIIDGSNSRTDIGMYPYKQIDRAGDVAALKCLNITTKPRLFVGSHGCVFEASLELDGSREFGGKTTFVVLGYRRLATIRWGVDLLPNCLHRRRSDEELTLPENTYTFIGYGSNPSPSPNAVYAGLTAGDSTARWLLMEPTCISNKRSSRWYDRNRAPLLRGDNCCFACAVKHGHDAIEVGPNALQQTCVPQLIIL